MKFLVGFLFFLTVAPGVKAQDPIAFDQVTYLAPSSWNLTDNGTYRAYSIVNNAAKTFCIISLYNSEVSTGNAGVDFRNSWKGIVASHFTVIKNLKPQPGTTSGGIPYLQDAATVASDQGSFFASLLVLQVKGKVQPVLFLSGDKNSLAQFQNDLDNFLSSIRPGNGTGVLAKTPVGDSPLTALSADFDDGWKASVKQDYVVLTKNNSRVLLYYPEPFNDESRANPVDYFYTRQLAKEYTITNTRARNDQYNYLIEGDGKENSTGKPCYIVMAIVSKNGLAKTVIEVAPTLDELQAQIGIDFEKMLAHNRFGATLQNIAGRWMKGSGSSLDYYDAYSGNYAYTNAVVMSNRFLFNSNGSYEAEFKGGSGMVGNMKFYQEHEKGSVKVVSPWQISTTSESGKTVVYDCWLEAIKGGMVLHLTNHQYSGDSYDLIREK